MDDVFLPEESLEIIKDVCGTLDPEIAKVLWQICSKERKEFEDELLVRFDHKTLKEIRVKVFRAALDKIELCLSHVARARTRSPDDTDIDDDIVHKADSLLRVLTPQDMINRRCVDKLATDIAELLKFIANEKAEMPTGMIKAATADVPLGRDLKRAVECIQRIVTAEIYSMNDNIESIEGDQPTSPNGETSDAEYEDAGDSNEKETLSDDLGSDNQIPERRNGNGKIDECDHDIIRALMGTEEDTCSSGEEMCYAQGKSIQAEIMNVQQDISDEGPICPLIVVSETSPKTNGLTQDFRGESDAESSQTSDVVQNIPLNDSNANEGAKLSVSNWPESCTPVQRDLIVPQHSKSDQAEIEITEYSRISHTSRKTFIVSIPPRDKSTSTADLWEHIESSQEEDIICTDPIFHRYGYDRMMSGNDGYQHRLRKKRETNKNDDACNQCGKKFEEMHGWRDNVSRRVSSVENSCTENMRQMRIMSDDVIDEVREVKHRLDAMDDARAHGITQQRQAQPNARDPPGHSHSESRNIDFDTRGRSSKRNSRQPGSVEDPRRRTASFSGPIRQSSKQSRPKQVVRIVDPPCVVEPEAPKDQRTRTRQNARRESRKNENPIKDWLSAAKAHPNKPTTNETQPASVPETLKSPSWADECDSEVNELETSDDFSTPTPTRYDCGREGAHGRDVSADSDEVIDVYEIPPSGQTTTTSRPATCDEEADVMYALPPANPTRSRGGRREQKTKPSNQNNKQQGDIPKQKGNIANESKGNNAQYNIGKNVTSKNGAKPKGKNSSAKNGKSYAMVVSENPWTTVQSNSGKKRKFEKVSPKLMFPLKGTASTNVKDVYLQGLDVEDGQTHDDVIDSVRAYCNGNGVKPVFIRIIPVKYDCTRTGCRLTIKIEDFERVMMESFWPELISVREWTPRNRDRFDQNEGREGDDLSDEN